MITLRFSFLLALIAIPLLTNADTFRTRWHQLQNATAHSRDDVRAEIEFGRTIAAHVLGKEDLLTNSHLTKYVSLVGRSLALHSSRQELEFRFGVLNSDAINAYSTPGGYVFITVGALNLVQDEAELAAILAHEIAHINSRHIVKELNIRGSEADQLSTLTRVISASSTTSRVAASQAIDSAMHVLFDQGYKVQDEIEADKQAMFLLATTGYDPMALPRFLLRVDDYLALNPSHKSPTHPASQIRYENMRQIAEEEHFKADNFLNVKQRFSRYISME